MSLTRTSEVRVRYAETDQMGVVHHRNFFTWFEVARTDFMRQAGHPYRDLEEQDVFMPVVEVGCRYRRPARYDEVLRIETRCSRQGRVRIRFDYRVLRADGELVAEGETVHVATDRQGSPRRLPDDLRDLLLQAGAGS